MDSYIFYMPRGKEVPPNAEEKIKQAAMLLFHQRGYAATRTRDIAAAAGINLALLNYYFRTKKQLFDLILRETIHNFFGSITPLLDDKSTSLERKFELMTDAYYHFLMKYPYIPVFLLSELRDKSMQLDDLPIKDKVFQSVLVAQIQEEIDRVGMKNTNPLQLVFNLLSLIMFPFMSEPMAKSLTHVSDTEFQHLLQERRKMIPIWMRSMFVPT